MFRSFVYLDEEKVYSYLRLLDIDGPDSTFEEAKYMLVSCSAFINYVMAVQSDV